MILSQAESFVEEYSSSEHFLFLRPGLKDRAESLLLAFFHAAMERGVDSLESLKPKTVEDVLMNSMSRLDLPAESKRFIPELLEGFFGFLSRTGRFPPAGAWEICVEANRKKYSDSIRSDGTARGATFKKNYTEVGRNEPCPCGSGSKFKKCCMPLIS
jgi:hypothetical protein